MAEKNEIRVYELDSKPPLLETLPLSLQHILLFLASTIAIPIIIGSALSFSGEDIALLIQCGIFTAGVSTVVQAFGLGPVGNRLPIIMGATFLFTAPTIAIGLTYGYDHVVGAIIVGGVAAGLVGVFFIHQIRNLFPPSVIGPCIMVIGLSLCGVGIDYCAGGIGSPNYGSWQNFLVAAITVILIVAFNTYGRGFVKCASVLIATLVAVVISFFFGMIDFSPLFTAPWAALPAPLHFGVSFHLPTILIIFILYLINMIEFIGDTSTVALLAADREPTEKELGRGILCDGFGSAFAGLFNAPPNISYSGNIGLIGLTKVKSRYVVGVAGIILIFLGFCPKLSTFLSLVPAPVIGGSSLVIFGLIATAGLRIMINAKLTDRDMMVIAISFGVGLGFNYTPDSLTAYPFFISALLKGVPGTALTAITLNLLLPRSKPDPMEQSNDFDR